MALMIKDNGTFKSLGGSGGGEVYHLRGVTKFKAIAWNATTVSLSWTDPENILHFDDTPIAIWAGTKVLRKTGDFPEHPNDGTVVVDSKIKNAYQSTYLEDDGLSTDTKYYYAGFPYTDKEVYTIDETARGEATPSALDDTSASPGPKVLLAGNPGAGIFGEVAATDLITGADLATAIGLTSGTAANSDIDWLKFSWQGKIIFMPKKHFRAGLQWNHIYNAGAIFGDGATGGTRQITINGLKYRVRVPRGLSPSIDPRGESSSFTGSSCHGSEWNQLILPITNKFNEYSGWTGSYPSYVEQGLSSWGINYGSGDIAAFSPGVWCQEILSETRRVYRGGLSYPEYSRAINPGSTYSSESLAWVPVLELIED